jgi:hypothetical protein
MAEVALDDYLANTLQHWKSMSKTFNAGIVTAAEVIYGFGEGRYKEEIVVITRSPGAENSINHVQKILEHEKTKFGATDRYTRKFPITNRLDAVNNVNYD